MSVSFDRAAEYYDRTRGYPPRIQQRIGQALLDAAGATPGARILEAGVGTGRIALPIIRAGYAYTGVDLSPRMLERLRAALREIPGAAEGVTLLEADVTALPFPDHSFDVIITVHVLHLVSDAARAIAEGVRVLARPGVALNGRDEDAGDEARVASEAWRETLHALGYDPLAQRERDIAGHVTAEWQHHGGAVDRLVAVEYETTWVPGEWVERMAQRVYSSTWAVPDEIYPEAIRRLRAWAAHHYGAALHSAIPLTRRFVVERARFA